MDERATLPAAVEFKHPFLAECHGTFGVCVDGPVLAQVRIGAGAVPKALLPYQDFTGRYALTAETFDAAAFSCAISAIAG